MCASFFISCIVALTLHLSHSKFVLDDPNLNPKPGFRALGSGLRLFFLLALSLSFSIFLLGLLVGVIVVFVTGALGMLLESYLFLHVVTHCLEFYAGKYSS